MVVAALLFNGDGFRGAGFRGAPPNDPCIGDVPVHGSMLHHINVEQWLLLRCPVDTQKKPGMSEDMITPVLRYALELCNARERGGRGIATNEFSGSILDCSCWHDEYTEAILSRYPQCSVAFVTAQDTSTSGFSVVLSIGRNAMGERNARARRTWSGKTWSGRALSIMSSVMHGAWTKVCMGMVMGDVITLVMAGIMAADIVTHASA